MQCERFGGWQACRGTHRVGGPIGIAAGDRREAANISDGIVDDLARFSVRRFAGFSVFLVFLRLLIGRKQRIAAELHRRGGADIGAWRHRRDRAGIGDIGAGAGGARAVRRDIGGDRYRRSENRADNLAHRSVETARRVHPQNDEPRLVGARGGKLARDVIGERRPDGAVDLEHNGTVGSRSRRRPQSKRGRGHHHEHGKTCRNGPQTCHVIRYCRSRA